MSAVSTTGLTDSVDRLTSVSLADLNDAAALQQRVDRKYIVHHDQLTALVGELRTRLAALDIDGDRTFAYESTYFDTVGLECFRAAAHKRRRRFKVRTRSYLDAHTTMLEIKTRGQRDVTVKQRRPHSFDARGALNDDANAFIDETLGRPGVAASLVATLTTRYHRTTLVDLDDIARVTIDSGLRCIDWQGHSVGLDDYVLETKSGGQASATDRRLWAMGIRPQKISKFGTGLAALHPELPSNKWHRTLQRHFPSTTTQTRSTR